jgi:DNA sulfur modification protein DndB
VGGMATTRMSFDCISSEFAGIQVYTLTMRVRDAIAVSYVAARGQNDEAGAVQRILSARRVGDIKNFVLEGNIFFNTFILNWTDAKTAPVYRNERIELNIKPRTAQILDGQHRMKGLELAMESDDSIGDKHILVSLCIALSTSEAAKIYRTKTCAKKFDL